MNLSTAPFKVPERHYPDAPEYRCGGCEYLFNWNEMVEIGRQMFCHECSWTARCIACDAVRRDTVTTPEGPMCPACITESATDIVEELLDAIFGEPCIDCGKPIRFGLQCVTCEWKARQWFKRAQQEAVMA